jgi:predicted RNase H-like HicB family nuclease
VPPDKFGNANPLLDGCGMNTVYEFVGVIHQIADEKFVLRFPDLPGCSASAPTEEVLCSRAAEALAECLTQILLIGNPVPQPSKFTKILSDPQWRDGRAMRISATERVQGRDDNRAKVG